MLLIFINSSQNTVSKRKENISILLNSFQNPFFPSTRIPAPANNLMAENTPSQPFSYMISSHTINIDLWITPTPDNVLFGQSL